MPKSDWLSLSAPEKALLLDALSSLRIARSRDSDEIDALATKLAKATAHPQISIGVQGGMVQWTRGNPFPIRIYDYDGHDLPQIDEHGDRCETWLEPADEQIETP
jgi:hypothetical protein